MTLAEFQAVIAATFGERDAARGIPSTVAWIAEEVGELAQAVRKGTREQQLHELGDVLAWVASLAHQLGLDLDEAAARYAAGCPRCAASPCRCAPHGVSTIDQLVG
ncbi:MAG TPA: MazG nucleotide pyrophosphohydrolase domain-containing protein [Phycicoccus sp.]|nr:MazG nucleotide pyrophosphohydrolase domain-containing protein [Phycicoccus sp.]